MRSPLWPVLADLGYRHNCPRKSKQKLAQLVAVRHAMIMATTLRIELGKAGFTVGGPGTTIVAQDYGDRKNTEHARPTATHTITSTDPILDLKFSNGWEWLGYRPIVAYDSTYVYVIVNMGYLGGGFKKIPLAPGSIGATIPHFEERARHSKRPT